MFKSVVLIGFGGFIGTVARFLVGMAITREGAGGFPYATFTVNIVGCFLIGIFAGVSERYDLLPETRAFLMTGLCGGFTTFSAFAIENVRLLQEKDYTTFLLYTAASFTVGIAATLLGLVLSKP
jgi:fluoride exporter